MPETLPEDLLTRFEGILSESLGLRFTADRRDSLRRGAESAAAALGFRGAASMIRSLMAAPLTRRQSDVIAMHLTVGETYFFRERELPDALGGGVLPDRPARIWCAGCSTGEEAYSVAMALDSLSIPPSRILATDINLRSLRCAEEGIFGAWSFRSMPDSLRDRYFQREKDGRFKIIPRIRSMVDFLYHNLAEDPYPSLANGTNAMDLILCRNVLLYFQPALRKRVVEGFGRALVVGGCLAVGSVESQQVKTQGLEQAIIGGATLFRKTGDRAKPVGDRAKPVGDRAKPVGDRAKPVGKAAASPSREPPRSVRSAAQRGKAREPADPETHASTARTLAGKGQLEEALRSCDAALSLRKTSPAYHHLYASILQELGRPEDAAAALRRALYLDKNFVIARFAMGQAARARGRPAESRRHFAAALEMLSTCGDSQILPGSDGVTAGGLAVTIRHLLQEETVS